MITYSEIAAWLKRGTVYIRRGRVADTQPAQVRAVRRRDSRLELELTHCWYFLDVGDVIWCEAAGVYERGDPPERYRHRCQKCASQFDWTRRVRERFVAQGGWTVGMFIPSGFGGVMQVLCRYCAAKVYVPPDRRGTPEAARLRSAVGGA